jgi:hypothetical protein
MAGAELALGGRSNEGGAFFSIFIFYFAMEMEGPEMGVPVMDA